ncbi:hypothetical protein JD844_027654, partial [Phrynosoma platyrhinos]
DEQKCFTCDSRYPYHPFFQANSHLIENVITDFETDQKKWWQSENGEWLPLTLELITFTNLRINFTKLHTLGDTLLGQKLHNPLDKYYYALYEMVVRGSCFCNGHASSCGPVQNLRGDVFHRPGMVHGSCLCEHNTDGLSCERCKDFYNDAPWRPAEGSQENACQKCECNGHSESCHFDMAVYLSNNRISGGVCEDCQHNTMGQHCDQCKLFFYRDPQKAISDPHACISCDCDPEGTMYNGLCESHTDPALGTIAGQCRCKENVEGVHCDKCKPNYYGMSGSDPLGCQPCNCNPSGSLSFSVCNPETGECLCQQFATGQHCEECLQGYWGIGSNLYGCSPCDCDIGGAHNNLCSSTNGQCECLPNIVGRQCTEPAAGHFFLPLDYYIYEAEDSVPLHGSSPLFRVLLLQTSVYKIQPTAMPRCDVYFRQKGYDFTMENGKIILNRNKNRGIRKAAAGQGAMLFDKNTALDIVIRESISGKPVTWSGPGFVRVQSGTGLRFMINNIPFLMDFNIIIRFEPESLEDWIASIVVKPSSPVGSEHCRSEAAFQEPHSLALPSTARIGLLATPVCLEPGREYFVDVYFSVSFASDSKTQSSILIDALGLIPRISSVENFCDKNDLEEYQQYHCIEIASEIGPHILPEACAKLIASLSARIHNGAVPCRCHPQGSMSSNCEKLGGQCQCKPNVIGRCCDKCSAGSHSFGSQGCLSCDCHPQGSVSALCDQVTGQCLCRPEVDGRQCNRCLAGYFGFPHCRPCPCNGFAELCDPQTGACLDCKEFTTGDNCERCIDGYYGNPLKREPCHPCMCPDSPTSNRYFAHSCYQDPWTMQLICNCLVGYSGNQCDDCPSGFYGNPKVAGQCLPCSCNNNIDEEDPDACDKDTGVCLKCLYDTHGPNCQFCKPGYFGSALLRNCTKCNCNLLGVDPTECVSGDGLCLCDQSTGICPCLPKVIGSKCDQCAPGYWNMIQGIGCHACDCNPKHSQNNLCDQARKDRKTIHFLTVDSLQVTGQCSCKLGYTGRRCDICDENYFGDPQIHCISCKCHKDGTLKPECDKDTGACNCRVGVTGRFCDQCARGYDQDFPSCSRCHICFDQQKVSQMYLQPDFLDQFPDLNRTIEDIRKDADHLSETLQKKNELHHRINYMHLQDLLNKIRNYYRIMLSVGERISSAKSVLTHGEKTRSTIVAMLEDFATKASIALDQLKMFNTSDIQNLNEKICGIPGNLPCVVSDCGGALCRDKQKGKHCGGPGCNGALPLSTNAIGKASQTAVLVNNLTKQMQGSENKIGSIRRMTEDTKKKATQIHGDLEKSRNQIEMEGENAKSLIKKLKNFLLEESAPPEDIEKVANYVLGITLPVTSYELTNVLEKLKRFMTHCDDSATYVDKLNKHMEEAQTLLVKAQKAENVTKALLTPDEFIRNLEKTENIQGQTKDELTKLNGKIAETKTKISEDFANLKKEYVILQEKLKTKGLPLATLEKMNQLKMEAEEFAKETEEKMKRIADLEKKIQDLNQIKQTKADQLKQLEDQVIAIKNEITEQSNKYATCKS